MPDCVTTQTESGDTEWDIDSYQTQNSQEEEVDISVIPEAKKKENHCNTSLHRGEWKF